MGLNFTYQNLKEQLKTAIENGYVFIKCEDYITYKSLKKSSKIVVLRVDIDFSVKKALELLNIFNELNIKATFFVRLHAVEYNPFSFENYRIIKEMINSGHEIGYHSEIVDQAKIWNEKEKDCLIRDIEIINRMYNIKIKGVASHGGMTGLNNLDFWKNTKPSEYGLMYEGYDNEEYNLFQESFYISDSEWTRWKCYNKGQLVEHDTRTFAEHTQNNHQIIHLLIHPDTYYTRHFYENEK